MNYYERHLGDYAKDTAHLSMLEHGAYSLLLDRYYATEQGIPDGQAHRVARARTKDEKQAVDSVLDEFFTLTDGVWINLRAEEEIVKAQGKIKAAQENGKKGGRPKMVNSGSKNETQTKPSGFPPGSENETQTKAHQTPDTRHQTPEEKHKRAPRFDAQAHLVGLEVDPAIAADWIKLRKAKRAEVTATAIDGIVREAEKAGLSLDAALRECCSRGWAGFKADWMRSRDSPTGRVINPSLEERNKAVAAAWVPPELRGAA